MPLYTILVSITALFAYVNHRFIRLPTTIGIMVLAMASSLVLTGLGRVIPELHNWLAGAVWRWISSGS